MKKNLSLHALVAIVVIVVLGFVFYFQQSLMGDQLTGMLVKNPISKSRVTAAACPTDEMPIIALSGSQNGVQAFPTANQTVANFNIAAKAGTTGFVVNSLKFTKSGSNNPDKYITKFDLYKLQNGNEIFLTTAQSQNSFDIIFDNWVTFFADLGPGFFVAPGTVTEFRIKADTTLAKTGVSGAQVVTFGLTMPGVSCGDGGLTYSFKPAMGLPKLGRKVSPSYPLQFPALVVN